MSSEYGDILFRDCSGGHSAQVGIELRLDGHVLPVAQAGGDRLIFDEPTRLPRSEAELAISVDGRERRWRVRPLPGQDASYVVMIETLADE